MWLTRPAHRPLPRRAAAAASLTPFVAALTAPRAPSLSHSNIAPAPCRFCGNIWGAFAGCQNAPGRIGCGLQGGWEPIGSRVARADSVEGTVAATVTTDT